MASKQEPVQMYEIMITLTESAPAIWRRVRVPHNILLSDLHRVIQVAMGWDDDHLHEFQIGQKRYGPVMEGFSPYENTVVSEDIVRLNGVAKPKAKFTYTYDFGDDWRHDIQIEREMAAETAVRKARCIEGAHACPPEDCGGIHRYAYMLEILADPQHDDHNDTMEWFGDGFDATAFDLADTDRAVATLAV